MTMLYKASEMVGKLNQGFAMNQPYPGATGKVCANPRKIFWFKV